MVASSHLISPTTTRVFMIDDTLPLSSHPRYVQPDTGAPWFACPHCACTHVRAWRLQTAGFGLSGSLCAASDADYPIPGSDRGVLMEFGRTYAITELITWFECGSCALAFRPDGGAIELDTVPRDWVAVHDDSVPASLGIQLREHISAPSMADLEPLRVLPMGEHVGIVVLELRTINGGWLDELRSDDTTGVHIHPDNFGLGAPTWFVAPFTDDAEWPGESIFDDSEGLCIAYSFEPLEGYDKAE